EAGGFDETRANLKAVRVIRREGEGQKNIVLNLKPVIEGTGATHFYLRPSDIVYVPERFSLF
nr:polysaccharide export protein [Verrucomicrobiota bacterium]